MLVEALGNDEVVIVTPALTAIVSCWVALSAVGVVVSVALTVKVEVPVAVGVPDIVFPLSVSPLGRVPAEIVQVYVPDPPVAARVCA